MVLIERKVNIDEISAYQKFHNYARGDDGAYSEFHESAPVGGEDDMHPIEWVRRVGGHDAVEGTCEQTKKIRRVTAVHSRKGTWRK